MNHAIAILKIQRFRLLRMMGETRDAELYDELAMLHCENTSALRHLERVSGHDGRNDQPLLTKAAAR